jgi:hypothetical protein
MPVFVQPFQTSNGLPGTQQLGPGDASIVWRKAALGKAKDSFSPGK